MSRKKKTSKFEKGHKKINKYSKFTKINENNKLKEIDVDEELRKEAERSFKQALRSYNYHD